ncbi:hypothetical protein L249_4831, partial [Ophiocordyceps polyrhachis-furcata BCC 54312]
SAKIAPRAKEGYFISIEGLYRHIYKVFLLDENKIVRACDVRFYNPANPNLDKSVTHIANALPLNLLPAICNSLIPAAKQYRHFLKSYNLYLAHCLSILRPARDLISALYYPYS